MIHCRLFVVWLMMLMTSAVLAREISQTPYGAQLYTVRAAMAQDFDGTLKRVADMGYREVEFAGLFDHDPAQVRALTRRLNLKIAGSHVDWKRLRDDPDGVIAETRKLGSPYLVFAWMPPEERQTIKQWTWWIAHLNDVADKARRQGIRLAYHAHDFEYQPIDGVRPIDLLLQGLDRKDVALEIDLYWTVRGGGDPLALFKAFPGRFPLVHMKDMSRTDSSMADVGDGRIDFRTIMAHAKPAGMHHFLVERDDSADPFLTLERSLAYLKSIHP